jgi:hypothetical protein
MSCINNSGNINETFIIEAQQVVSADTFVTGFTLSSNTITLTQNREDQYSAFTISLSGITGSSTSVGGSFLPLSGGTVTGGTSFISGLTASTISATTISGGTFYGDGSQLTGIIASAVFTGGTVNGATNFLNGLTANTISATVYENLPNTLYTGDGSLSGNRIVDIGTNSLNFDSPSYPNTLFLSNGNVSINTASPVTKLDVRGGVHMGVGTPTVYAGNAHTVEITSSGGAAPLSLIGGSATVELWIDSTPTKAVMFGAGAPGVPADGDFHFSTYDAVGFWKDRLIIKNSTGYVGIGTSAITNTLHVSGATNPVRFEGLTSATDNNILTVDLSGVVHTFPISGISGSGLNIYNSDGTLTGNRVMDMSAYTLTLSGRTNISYSPSSFTDSPLVIKNTDPNAIISNVISFDCDATGFDQPVFMNFASTNPKGFGFYASNVPITSIPDGAAFQMYNNASTTFPGQVFFDSGANDNAAIIWRTAPTSGIITERMRVTSAGKVGIGTSTPKVLLQVGDGGGTMLYPYEQLVVERNGDTKLSVYTSVSSPSLGGAAIVLGYSNFLTDVSLYPGFEFQHVGSTASTQNYVRYNFIQRDGLGNVSTGNSKEDLLNIYSDGSVTINGKNLNSKLGVGVNSSAITNTLHISATTDPVRFVGLTSATDNNILTVDLSGVVHTIALSAITGSATSVSGAFLPLSGGTVTGATNFTNGLSANTISAQTYQNVNAVTGGTYNSGTGVITLSGTGSVNGTQITGFSTSVVASGAFLPLSGGTVSGTTFFTSALTVNLLTVTGNTRLASITANTLTVTGNTRLASITANTLNVTGSTTLSTLTGTSLTLTGLVGVTDRVMQVNSGGTVSASVNIISAYISSASTAATQLSNASNWDLYGVYAGASITGTSMGQKHYDDNYFYEAVADNTFIRLIRG